MRRLALLLVSGLLMAGCERRGEREEMPQPTGKAAVVATEAAPPSPVATAAVPEIAGRYAPRDECGAQPGWSAFAGRLAAAVKARDAAALVALADPAIVLDFGGGSGREELQRRLAGDKGRQLWTELDAILRLGCAKGAEPGHVVLPWFFGQDLGVVDPYQVLLVVGDKVPLRAVPDPAAPPLALVSWHLADTDEDRGGFRKVSLGDGKVQGYIAADALRSPLGYRLVARQRGGEWRLMAFVAGD